MSNVLNDLYARKGQIVTTQEILQNQLNEINKGINAELNKGNGTPGKDEKKKDEKKDKKEKKKKRG